MCLVMCYDVGRFVEKSNILMAFLHLVWLQNEHLLLLSMLLMINYLGLVSFCSGKGDESTFIAYASPFELFTIWY